MKNQKPREGPAVDAVTVGIYMPAALHDSVLRIAAEQRRTASNLMRLFIEQGVAQEDSKKEKK